MNAQKALDVLNQTGIERWMAPGWSGVHISQFHDVLLNRTLFAVSGQYAGKSRREVVQIDDAPFGNVQAAIEAFKSAIQNGVRALDVQPRPAAAYVKA